MHVMLTSRLSPVPQNCFPRQILQKKSIGPECDVAIQYRQGPFIKCRILVERPKQGKKSGIHIAGGTIDIAQSSAK